MISHKRRAKPLRTVPMRSFGWEVVSPAQFARMAGHLSRKNAKIMSKSMAELTQGKQQLLALAR